MLKALWPWAALVGILTISLMLGVSIAFMLRAIVAATWIGMGLFVILAFFPREPKTPSPVILIASPIPTSLDRSRGVEKMLRGRPAFEGRSRSVPQ